MHLILTLAKRKFKDLKLGDYYMLLASVVLSVTIYDMGRTIGYYYKIGTLMFLFCFGLLWYLNLSMLKKLELV